MRHHKSDPKNGMQIEIKDGRARVYTLFDEKVEPSKTQQQFADELDVNAIMARFMKTGEWPGVQATGTFADVSKVGSYQEMLEAVKKADQAFQSLPNHIRTKFENNPQKYVEFLEDPTKLEESYELKLRERKQPDPVLAELKTLNENLKTKT